MSRLMGFKKKDTRGLIAECKKRGGTVKTVKKAKSKDSYWRNKADALFSDIVRSCGHCEICMKQGQPRKSDSLPVVGLDVHHLIERGQYGYRYDLMNGISLCTSCHGSHVRFRNRFANAHGNEEQKANFLERLRRMNKTQYDWYMKNKDIKKRTSNLSFEQEYIILVKVWENLDKKGV
jgi:hypothetical protein